jgi:hypothetical protein
MAVAYQHRHADVPGSHRLWPIVGAIIAFLLALLWAKPIG